MASYRERNTALRALNIDWARITMPNASSDHVRLAAMHKARVKCEHISAKLKLDSVEWLRKNGSVLK